MLGGRQARPLADRTIDVQHPVADAADEMVVVVPDPVLIPGGRPGRLDAPDEPVLAQIGKRVVDRLRRDRTDLGPGPIGNQVCRDVRYVGDRPQDRQSLGGDTETALT
jgi:hypothetical protein